MERVEKGKPCRVVRSYAVLYHAVLCCVLCCVGLLGYRSLAIDKMLEKKQKKKKV